jgi:hypothetical protein
MKLLIILLPPYTNEFKGINSALYSASTDEAERSCRFLVPSRNCMTQCQALTATAAKIIHTTVQLCLTSC